MRTLYIGGVLYIVLILPPTRALMESVMIVHMLVQLPLLLVSGWLVGNFLGVKFSRIFDSINHNGIPGIILFFTITLYWMIPRAVDEALTFPLHELLKLISLPVAGILLASSWNKIKSLGKSFIYLNYLSMFGLMGWLYLDSPIQICNNYLVIQQQVLGWGFLLITVFMIMYIIQYVFVDHSVES